MKLDDLTKSELVDLTTRLLDGIGAYPSAQHTVYHFLLERWNKKRRALEEKAKRYSGFLNFSKWEKVQKEMDAPKNDIEFCTHLEEMKQGERND